MNGSWLDRHRNKVFIVLLSIALSGIGVFFGLRPTPGPVLIISPEPFASPTATVVPSPTPAPVRIYISGAVVNSDVYFLSPGSIIKDAIKAAGGFTPEADPEGINQALELRDQQQIHVPRLGQDNPPPVQDGPPEDKPAASGSDGFQPSPGPAALLDLNTATLEQLDTLPGIGPVIAQRIIAYREQTGQFTAVDEIKHVSGIGDATYAKLRHLITVVQ